MSEWMLRPLRRWLAVPRTGYTLVEVMVGTVLVALIVSAIFALTLTTQVSSKKSGRRAKGLYYTRQAMERLKSYVTADSTSPGLGPTASWIYPGDASNTYALSPGIHDITNSLPSSFRTELPGATLVYTVSNYACGARVCQQVTFSIRWDEEPLRP